MHALSDDDESRDLSPELTSYDRLVYESWPYSATHPDRAAVLARLFGMFPASPSRCRVLEIGCGAGGNLIPMADSLPGSEFVGIDLASTQIARGVETIARLGLTNISLHAMDLAAVERQFGDFDFVLAHGVYSWIPDAAKDRLLAIYAKLLKPHGVGFVSYNTLPGWHMRGMVRDMTLQHAARFTTTDEQVKQARALLDFLTESQPRPESFFALMLKREREILSRESDGYIAHEMLEAHNDPVYFTEFARRLAGKGLQFLAEADFSMMVPKEFAPSVADTLKRICGEIVLMEQYLDFLRCRTFRQSLVCRADLPVMRELFPRQMGEFWLATTARPQGGALDLGEGVAQMFKTSDGATVQLDAAIAKAAFAELSDAWPARLRLPDLCGRARRRVSGGEHAAPDPEVLSRDAHAIGAALLRGYSRAAVQLFTEPAPYAIAANERPQVSRLVRDQAERGDRVTNRRHDVVKLDEAMRRVACLADGTLDRSALLLALNAFEPVTAPPMTAVALDDMLTRMARLALFVA